LWFHALFSKLSLPLKPAILIDNHTRHKSMTSSDPISPVLARACDLSQEIIRKRGALRKVQTRLGTSFEKPDDMEQARRLGHELKGLIQEKCFALHLFDTKPAAARTPTVDAA
jgi:hypothetical protein